MGKAILGGVVGYIVMFVFMFVTFTVLYLVLGADGSFKPAVWDPSMTWIVAAFVLGLFAAILGGMVCAKIANAGSKAPTVLAVVVLVIGFLSAIPVFMAKDDPDAGPRPDEVGSFEAMTSAKQPVYVALINPFLGAVGVIIGARMTGKGNKNAPVD